jgi:adenylate cyclase
LSSRDIRRAVIQRLLIANLVAAVLTGAAIELAEPARDVSVAARLAGAAAIAVVVASVFALVALRRWRARERRLWGWLDDGRDPTPAERDLVLDEPWQGARLLFRYWLIGAALVGLLFLGDAEGRSRMVPAGAVATILGGLTATTLSFFLAERAMRPALVLALAGQPRPTTLGVRRRIVIAWLLGSGVALAWIAFVPLFRHPASDVPLGFLTTFLGVAGFAAGASLAYLVGGSIGGPIEKVRRGLQSVEGGNLDVVVPVDDAGELGVLEAGFNRMVNAVTERQRLQELFGKHVGEEVARRALGRGIDLDGEVVEVSVLFVDIVGSTALATQQPPAEVVRLLNRFFSTVVSTVSTHGGWVNKFQGDAALCVFGAPEPQADHAARSLRAARTLRAALLEVDAGLGISAGQVIAGNVGTEARLEYTVIGHPVNEAARLVEQAKRREGRVLASAAVVERAGDEADEWRPAGEVALRGIATPVEVFEPRRCVAATQSAVG